MKFPCTQCGACCSLIEGISFLEKFNDHGRCVHLKNNQCAIYEERPLLCNIDEAYEKIFSSMMTKESFYHQNAMACNQLQEKLGIAESYRVVIKDFS